MRGKLTIVPIEAFILTKPGLRLFATQLDTYIKFKVGNRQCSSGPCKQKGINPFWEDVLTLKKGSSNTLKIQLIDRHTFLTNQLVGEGGMKLQGVVLSTNMNKHEVWLMKDQQVTAKLAFEIFFQKQDKEKSSVSKNTTPTQSHIMSQNQDEATHTDTKAKPQNKQQASAPQTIKQNNDQSDNPLKQSPGKKIKKRIMKIVEQEFINKQKQKAQAPIQSPKVYDYLAEGKFPNLSDFKITQGCDLSIQQMKLFHDKEYQYRNTLESQVINLKDFIFGQTINESVDKNQQKKQNQEQKEEKVRTIPEPYETYNEKKFTQSEINAILFS